MSRLAKFDVSNTVAGNSDVVLGEILVFNEDELTDLFWKSFMAGGYHG